MCGDGHAKPLGDRTMEEMTFGSRFQAAAAKAYVFATSMVSETLPPDLRINLALNSSYDGDPLKSDEVVFPNDSDRDSESLVRLTIIDAAKELWRDQRVPEWIDLAVEDCTSELTIIRALCCGRFTKEESNLYHVAEGYPPFHVTGPWLPPGWDSVEKDGRFSIKGQAQRAAQDYRN